MAPGWILSQLAIHFLLLLLGGAPGGGGGEGGGCHAVNVVRLFSSLLTLRVNKLECFTIAYLKCAGEDKSLPAEWGTIRCSTLLDSVITIKH